MDEPAFEKARDRAVRMLAYRGRSVQEVSSRLESAGYSRSMINRVVSWLEERDFLNDEAFAREWARNCAVNKLWGNRKITLDLREKGISGDAIERAIAAAREEIKEHEALEMLLNKKLKNRTGGKTISLKDKGRLYRTLAGRGFPPPLIYEALRTLKEESIDYGE